MQSTWGRMDRSEWTLGIRSRSSYASLVSEASRRTEDGRSAAPCRSLCDGLLLRNIHGEAMDEAVLAQEFPDSVIRASFGPPSSLAPALWPLALRPSRTSSSPAPSWS